MDTLFITVFLLILLIFFTSRAKNKKSKSVLLPQKIISQPPSQQIHNKHGKKQTVPPPMELITSEIPCGCEIDMSPIPRDVYGVDDRYVDIIERRKLNKRAKTEAAKRTVNLYKENFNNELDAEDNRAWWGEDEY